MNPVLFSFLIGAFICQLTVASATMGCTYGGKHYAEGDSWPVACEAICTCYRQNDLFYMDCKAMCSNFALPPGCTIGYLPTRSMTLSRDCCPVAVCPEVPEYVPYDD